MRCKLTESLAGQLGVEANKGGMAETIYRKLHTDLTVEVDYDELEFLEVLAYTPTAVTNT